MMRKLLLPFLLLTLLSCNKKQEAKLQTKIYFDLEDYFAGEVKRLTAGQKTIQKTVMINGEREEKPLKIRDWKKELSIFAEADINKVSWKGLFKADTSASRLHYTSADSKVQVKDLDVTRTNGRITHISILLKRENMLYTSIDTLNYYPDSLYSIARTQRIKLLAEKNYLVKGKF